MSKYPTIDLVQEAARRGLRSVDALPAGWTHTMDGWPSDWFRESGTGIYMAPPTAEKLTKELAERSREELRGRIGNTKEILKGLRGEVAPHRTRYLELLDELTKTDPADASRVYQLTSLLAQASHSFATVSGSISSYEVTLAELQETRA